MQKKQPADPAMNGRMHDENETVLLAAGLVLSASGCGENTYVFLDEEIQLGVPEADVRVDQQESLHLWR